MDTALRTALLVLASYLLGAIPFSYIAGRLLKRVDLREHGSGNLGAANTFRVLGKGAAIPVLLADIGKGYIAVSMVALFGLAGYSYAIAAALAVIVGHNYSVFVGFSGGKGVGTTTGVFIALAPCAVLICVIIWFAVLLLSRIVSVASMVSAVCLPPAVLIMNGLVKCRSHYSVFFLALIVALLVIYKHRSNIARLREGTEKRIF